MARPEVTGKSVAEFCRDWGISRSTFNNWDARGVGPVTVQPVPRGRKIITPENEDAFARRHARRAGELVAAE